MTCFSDVKTEESKCSLKEVYPLISTLVPPCCPQSSGCTEVPQEFSSVSSSLYWFVVCVSASVRRGIPYYIVENYQQMLTCQKVTLEFPEFINVIQR